jgi:hypothetical protein
MVGLNLVIPHAHEGITVPSARVTKLRSDYQRPPAGVAFFGPLIVMLLTTNIPPSPDCPGPWMANPLSESVCMAELDSEARQSGF